MAQHFMPRQGSRRGSENAPLMNRYDCELVRDGQKWRFKRVTIDMTARALGNPEILNALAIQRTLAAKASASEVTLKSRSGVVFVSGAGVRIQSTINLL